MMRGCLGCACLGVLALTLGTLGQTQLVVAAGPEPIVWDAQAERVAVIAKVRPSVVAVCFYGGKACGSGVLIDPAGYALTNFHVVQPTGAVMQCGLDNGELYDAVLVGQDKVGDVALIKLLPKKPGEPFPFAKMANSDQVQVGEWSLAMGNPFGLSLDFTPTVTYGLVSGVNRYQPPEGKGTLEYTDCIQIDTSINPGNSGGPLFNMKGELIGINGRGSFEKRGRVNSGVGYAISINQIKNFLGHLYAGLDTDHATLGALVETRNEDGNLGEMVIGQILEESDAFRRGLQPGDQLVTFAGRPVTSTNQYKNILGIFPKGWRLPLTIRRDNQRRDVLVRLMGNLDAPVNPSTESPMPPQPRPGAAPKDPNAERAKKSPAAKLYEAKKGFANFYFNKLRRDELLKVFRSDSGKFAGLDQPWELNGEITLADRKGALKIRFQPGTDELTEVKLLRNNIEDSLIPLKPDQPVGALLQPQGSGGMLATLYQYRRLLIQDGAAFEGGVFHAGHEPFYPPQPGKNDDSQLSERRVDCEVLRTKHGAFETKWYFSRANRQLLGCESTIVKEEDPCELYFFDYRDHGGHKLPHRIEVWHGSKPYATLLIRDYQFGK
ncbi:MAG: trypsin-like peptidase domain-containing protein [Bacteroidales bacterium]|nr:trypsin-like peptidase domain-containing protein [Bacteroidales bacterium]